MNRDHFDGGVRNLQGRGKTAIGAVTGRARQQVEGAYDQAAGAAQYAYGEARDTVNDLRRDGERFIGEASSRAHALADEAEQRRQAIADRGYALADEAQRRGRHYRGEAVWHGRAVAARADENKAVTLALVAAAAFGLGWLLRPSR
ncbi:CsbD family protein [Methylobacterium sp. SD274]|uniref:CsbD family protein n=1 Tax=Methylobacterium sp. SD274 TaxID=2782009 RepID=UPI001A96BDD8|nr:CsbD family protein [Methylobacterium sp. SD274]MBO1019022.1 CsbD family protein [Methylobacterium sp. SD274]